LQGPHVGLLKTRTLGRSSATVGSSSIANEIRRESIAILAHFDAPRSGYDSSRSRDGHRRHAEIPAVRR